jgi:hypothetical protein
MRRSANKLCAETHYERYAKCLLGIKFTKLAAQPVSRSEESKVTSGNPFLENTYLMEQNLISYIRYYIRMRNIIIHIPNKCFVQPFSHIDRKPCYADQKCSNMCCFYSALFILTLYMSPPFTTITPTTALFSRLFDIRKSVASTVFRITVRYSTESRTFQFNVVQLKVLTSLSIK